MADENSESNERTQDPTPRRLEEALQRGDVVKSMEVNTWFAIAGGTLAMMIFAVPMASNLQATFRGLLARSYQIPTDGAGLTALTKTLLPLIKKSPAGRIVNPRQRHPVCSCIRN